MSIFGAFLLAASAFVGTLMFLSSPFPKLIKRYRGKKWGSAKQEIEDEWETDGTGSLVKAAGCCFYLLLANFFTFIVQPLGVFTAIVGKIGYQPAAYAMLAIVALAWLYFGVNFLKNLRNTPKPEASKTEEEEAAEKEKVLELEHPLWFAIRRFFFALPTFYLWYLFLVAIGVLK